MNAVDMSVVGLVEDSSGKAKAGATEPSGEKAEENAAEPSEARAEEKTPRVSGVKVREGAAGGFKVEAGVANSGTMVMV